MTGDAAKAYRQLYPMLMRDVHGQLGPAPVIPGVEIPMILFGLARRGSPLLPANWPVDDRAQAIHGTHVIAAIDARREPFIGYNVIARVPGTDPVLRGTYVAFGAHYDHIGILPPLNGDSIANGADDDGSGSMALLAIANVMVHHPMRRSALFVWHVGEEKGLLGSAYFTANPTVSLDSIVAQLNVDMIGRNEPDKLYVVGPKAAPNGQSRRLGAIVDSVNALQPSPFPLDRSWDDANNPEQIYQRSDHYNYARHGIPIAFFTSGLHDDYHEVSDEADRIDYAKLARVSRLIFDVAQAVGNSVTRPR
jgi:Zn-dependent M28 family amino/carboxypeptidase